MDLDEARDYAAEEYQNDPYPDERAIMRRALYTLAARLDEIERRARQVRGGLKPYARPVEVVDFLLVESGTNQRT